MLWTVHELHVGLEYVRELQSLSLGLNAALRKCRDSNTAPRRTGLQLRLWRHRHTLDSCKGLCRGNWALGSCLGASELQPG